MTRETQGADGAGTMTAGEIDPGRAAFARWSSLSPEYQDRIWASMSDDVRAFWVRQEDEQAGAAAATVTPWKTGQSGYAREALVLNAEEQALEIAVTTAGRIDLIIHNRAGDGFDDLTARMSRKDACRLVAALVEAGASEAPGVLWSAWPEDDCDSDPRIDPMVQKCTEWFVGRWPVGAEEPECRILVGQGRSAEIVARRIAERLTSVLNTDAIQGRASTPAPAPTPGVPDSLLELSEAASEDWATNDATPYILGPQIDGEHDRFEVIARGPHGHAKSGDAIRKWQANRMFAVAAVNHVRALIAAETTATPYGWTYIWASDDCDGGAVEQKFSRTKPDATNPYISDIVPLFASHPAGQSAGQGELIRSLQIELSIAQGANRALKEWIKGYRIKGRFQALGQLPAGQSEDDVERCIACAEPLKAGEWVLPDAEGGTIHTACCGPERESYTGANDEALGPNDPIPQGYVYEGEQPTEQERPDRKWVCNGDPAQPTGQSAGSGTGADAGLKDAIADIVSRAEKDQAFLRRTLARMREEPAPPAPSGQAETEGEPLSLSRIKDAISYSAHCCQDGSATVSRQRLLEWREGIRAALAARPEAPSDAGWIKVEDQLPGEQGQDSDEVIVFLNGHCDLLDTECRKGGAWGHRFGWFDAERQCFRVHGRPDASVTHWMPKPPPPSDPAPSGQAEG